MNIGEWISSKSFLEAWKSAFLDYPISPPTKYKPQAPRAYEKAGSYWFELREPAPGIRLLTLEVRKDVRPVTLSLRCWFYEQANEQYKKLAAAGILELFGEKAARYLDQRPQPSWQAKLNHEGVRAIGIRYSISLEERLDPNVDPVPTLKTAVEKFCSFISIAINGTAVDNLLTARSPPAYGSSTHSSIDNDPNWEKALHALLVLGGKANVAEIHAELVREYGNFKFENVRKDLTMLSVNDKARFAYRAWETRHGKAKAELDRVFFAGGIGKERIYEIYSPSNHGFWEVYLENNESLNLRKVVSVGNPQDSWTDAELEAAVFAYLDMAQDEAAGRSYFENRIFKELATQFNRSAKAVGYCMQNISTVLHELGREWLPGFTPAGKVDASINQKIHTLLYSSLAKVTYQEKITLYKTALPLMRQWLIRIAQAKKTVARRELMEAFGIDQSFIRQAIDDLGHQSQKLKEPLIVALIVKKGPGRTSPKVWKKFGVENADLERNQLYEFWNNVDTEVSKLPHNTIDTFNVKAARFVSVETRPDQAAFRRRVFYAYQGRCVISGCDVVNVLDAAHKQGRSWKLGHNQAEDGYILRKDLHALYDCGLLTIGEDGTVSIALPLTNHYQEYSGVKITQLKPELAQNPAKKPLFASP